MGDTSMPLNTSFAVVANANASLNGVVYLPKAAVSWQGCPSSGIACATFIAYTFDLGGNPALGNQSGCNLPGGSGGSLLFNSTVTLVQ